MHPFAYLKKQFIQPQGITLAQVSKATGIGLKSLSELNQGKRALSPAHAIKLGLFFSVQPEFLMKMQVALELERERKRLAGYLKTHRPAQSQTLSPSLLLATVNNSIGDRAKHYKSRDLTALFLHPERLSPKKKYALKTIFSEASPDALDAFVKANAINAKDVLRAYRLFIHELGGVPNATFKQQFSGAA